MNRPPPLVQVAKTTTLQTASLTYAKPHPVGAGSPIEVVFNKVMSSLALSFASRLIVLCASDHTQMVGANTEASTTDVVNNEIGFNGTVMGELITETVGSLVPPPRVSVASATRERHLSVSSTRAAGCPCPQPASR